MEFVVSKVVVSTLKVVVLFVNIESSKLLKLSYLLRLNLQDGQVRCD